MNTYLEQIIASKEKAVSIRKQKRGFKEALRKDTLQIIAEVKRGSPSKGLFSTSFDPVELALEYREADVAALSVITSKEGFQGKAQDLVDIVENLPAIPVLRKDFIFDPIQVYETKGMGASALLLIVSVTKNNTRFLLELARSLELDVLVEVHSEKEIEVAVEAGADLIGVNNRNLGTFEVNLNIAERLSSLIPDHIVKVAESGIATKEDAERMKRAGYDAVLVGEALVRAQDRKQIIRELSL
jgi:indole-3-glycerol phosphate synthase